MERCPWHVAYSRRRRTDAAKSIVKIRPQKPVQKILPDVLRRLHAQQAAVLAEKPWLSDTGEQLYLISDSDLRFFYGPTIGDIAHSHWWSAQKVYEELFQDLGAFPQRTRNLVDRVKVACLLRIADALHLNQLRAPRLLRALTRPAGCVCAALVLPGKAGATAHRWTPWCSRQGALLNVLRRAVVACLRFPLSLVDRELRDVELVLQARGRQVCGPAMSRALDPPKPFQKW